MAPYMASLSVMRAKTYAEYSSALEGWGCPSVNHIYADTANTIAWKPSGASPSAIIGTGCSRCPVMVVTSGTGIFRQSRDHLK